ncbi:hypothetical protein Ddye_010787 [Dipteronia dyeriana]|uniref:UDP-glycosyltransferase n=1 Tax=Dipteronia dyeriana TaxID=168575 RepID=A0AAD9XDV0_9ROSI|nr:hypothetical protein Ddye_010787 [Dipteronia dyeriana]
MEQTNVPHVMFLPFPAQGHIKPMMNLAELLNQAGSQVTFVNINQNHDRPISDTELTSFHDRSPKFLFRSIPVKARSFSNFKEWLDILQAAARPAFRQLLISTSTRPTCIIADGIMSFAAIDVAEELGIPVVTFRTQNASCTWTCFHLSKLVEAGEVPFPDGNLDKSITCIPGYENILRFRDLPSICRVEKADDPVLNFFMRENSTMTRASALILNTFHELEAPVISRLSSVFKKIYAIGPLHALHKSRISQSDLSNGAGIWKEDRSCMTWLDLQPLRSVIYVSFGSVVNLTRLQALEFWHGLVNSGKPFLWVMRPDLIVGESGIDPVELETVTKERGFVVSWAPQEEVLAHPAVGGFLTHSGWNSTSESINAGVPMICWPQISDQQVNSRCVSEVWKIGFDMKDTCDRSTVEKFVSDLMDSNKIEEIMKSTDKFARLARDSVKEGGSSNSNLENLIEDIRSMKMEQTNVPHVMFLPFPAQGHIKPMMKLAELLNQSGSQVTFVNINQNHDRPISDTDLTSFHDRSPKFLFRSIPVCLWPDKARSFSNFKELLDIPGCGQASLPSALFSNYDHLLTSFCYIEKIADGNLDKSITCIPGYENILRFRDLPSICRVEKADDPVLNFFMRENSTMTRASALILNTFHELEAPVISRLSSVFKKIYAIGPLHALHKSRISQSDLSNGAGIWKEDRSCMTWLDLQPLRSVIYVSFGSVVNLTRLQALEFWHGLVNSGKPFLWVMRPDLIVGESGIDPVELETVTKERGFVVSWAPQEEVLAHPAVGGFLTHSGWNSTSESINAGVPMICWPQISDQQVNKSVKMTEFDISDVLNDVNVPDVC